VEPLVPKFFQGNFRFMHVGELGNIFCLQFHVSVKINFDALLSMNLLNLVPTLCHMSVQ
jgi:hypothetical protein